MYFDFFCFYQGEFSLGDFCDEEGEVFDEVILGYGLGIWYFVEGDEVVVFDEYDCVFEGLQWVVFGYFVVEVEVVRLCDLG